MPTPVVEAAIVTARSLPYYTLASLECMMWKRLGTPCDGVLGTLSNFSSTLDLTPRLVWRAERRRDLRGYANLISLLLSI